MNKIDNFNWRCFLSIEEELINTQNFVEIHKNNYRTFSLKYRSIIMQACSEIEIVCKHICGISPDDKTKDMKDYGNFISDEHKDFFVIEILIPIYNEKVQPWLDCQKCKSPSFWNAYNAIKHQGKLEDATLENAINSLAGLFSLLLGWYVKSHGQNFSENEVITMPKLFNYPGLSPSFLVDNNSYHVIVPGFEIARELA